MYNIYIYIYHIRKAPGGRHPRAAHYFDCRMETLCSEALLMVCWGVAVFMIRVEIPTYGDEKIVKTCDFIKNKFTSHRIPQTEQLKQVLKDLKDGQDPNVYKLGDKAPVTEPEAVPQAPVKEPEAVPKAEPESVKRALSLAKNLMQGFVFYYQNADISHPPWIPPSPG